MAAITSRGAGWFVASVLAGATTALSILVAAGPSTTVVQPLGAVRAAVPAGPGGVIYGKGQPIGISPGELPVRQKVFIGGPGGAASVCAGGMVGVPGGMVGVPGGPGAIQSWFFSPGAKVPAVIRIGITRAGRHIVFFQMVPGGRLPLAALKALHAKGASISIVAPGRIQKLAGRRIARAFVQAPMFGAACPPGVSWTVLPSQWP
jgi:hypothetical protein